VGKIPRPFFFYFGAYLAAEVVFAEAESSESRMERIFLASVGKENGFVRNAKFWSCPP
jgi:hypothetical protein